MFLCQQKGNLSDFRRCLRITAHFGGRTVRKTTSGIVSRGKRQNILKQIFKLVRSVHVLWLVLTMTRELPGPCSVALQVKTKISSPSVTGVVALSLTAGWLAARKRGQGAAATGTHAASQYLNTAVAFECEGWCFLRTQRLLKSTTFSGQDLIKDFPMQLWPLSHQISSSKSAVLYTHFSIAFVEGINSLPQKSIRCVNNTLAGRKEHFFLFSGQTYAGQGKGGTLGSFTSYYILTIGKVE